MENVHVFLSGESPERQRQLVELLPPEKRRQIIENALPGTPVVGSDLVEVLQQGGAAFEVGKRPIADYGITDRLKLVNSYRTDTGAPLGIVGENYGVVQTDLQLGPLGELMRQGQVEAASVQVVQGGALVRVGAIIGASTVGILPDGKPDTLAHMALFEVSHAGQKSNRVALYTIRLACLNGMTAQEMVRQYTLRHTSQAAERAKEATRIFLGMQEEATREVEVFQQLRARPMSVPDFRAFANELLDEQRGTVDRQAKDEEHLEKLRKRRENAVEELVGFFTNGQGNRGATAWDGYNGITEWLDHKRSRRGVTDQRLLDGAFESNAFGSGNRYKARALRMLRAR